MGVVPTNPIPGAADEVGKPQRFWQRVAQSLDRLVVSRGRQAVPAIALRRSRYEFQRCRRMLHGRP